MIRLALTGLGSGAFCLLALSVAGSAISNQTPEPGQPWIDRIAIEYRIRHEILANRPRRLFLLQFVPWLSPIVLVIMALAIAALALWRSHLRWALAFGTAALTAPLVRIVLKPLINRQVPPATGAEALTFPSGHLTILGALLMALFLITNGTGAAFRTMCALMFVAIAVGFGVVFTLTGNHFATDCIGGLLIGACVVSGEDLLFEGLETRMIRRRQRVSGAQRPG